MKKIYAILVLILSGYCMSQAKEYSFNLSTIKKGEQSQRSIYIVNTTNQAVYIKDVQTGCVCTKADYPKQPISPGDSSKIEITFHAKDPGVFYKVINVKTSDKSCDSKITIRGKVN